MYKLDRLTVTLLPIVFAGCLSVGIGPLTLGPSQGANVPLLYADPGVLVYRPGEGELSYRAGMQLQTGDRVTTSDGQAVIDFDNDNIVAMQRRSSVELGSIRLFFGELFARVRELTQRGGGRIVTDELTASVEGTEYAVRRDPERRGADGAQSWVTVRRGEVLCEPGPGALWQPRRVTANQVLSAYDTVDIADIAPADAAGTTRWADDAIGRLLEPRSYGPDVNVTVPVGGTRDGGMYNE